MLNDHFYVYIYIVYPPYNMYDVTDLDHLLCTGLACMIS